MSELNVRLKNAIADFSILASGGIILLILFTGVTPTRRGFFCDDDTIKYPFHSSTIPNFLLYIYGFSVPIIVIFATEFIGHRRNSSSGILFIRPAPLWLIHLYKSLVYFLFGVVCSQLITDIGKYSIGRLRPNFIDVCKPNFPCGNDTKHDYVTEYVCMGSKEDAVESRVSFPSGHASFSAYTMLYVAIYIQCKWPLKAKSSLRILRSAFQLSLFAVAYFTALSRVMDNKHHWSDVTAGALIGSIVACLNARYVSNLIPEVSGGGARKENGQSSNNMLDITNPEGGTGGVNNREQGTNQGSPTSTEFLLTRDTSPPP